jgi:hypothetical protein
MGTGWVLWKVRVIYPILSIELSLAHVQHCILPTLM